MAKMTGKRRNNRSREDLEKIKAFYKINQEKKENIVADIFNSAFGLSYPKTEGAPIPIDQTLNERGKRYGDFVEHARITQALKKAMVDSSNWATLSDDKKEALEMVAHKIGRILNGDPNYHDSWHDILGYVRLVEATLREIRLSEATAVPSQSPAIMCLSCSTHAECMHNGCVAFRHG